MSLVIENKLDRDIRVKIAGRVLDPEYYDYLTRMIEKLGLKEHVEFCKEREIRSIYKEAKILWNPSKGYFGIVNVEAMNFGVVPIALPNYADTVINSKTGFIAFSTRDFVEKAALILTNESLRKALSRNAVAFSYSFTEDAFKSKFKTLLEKVLNS